MAKPTGLYLDRDQVEQNRIVDFVCYPEEASIIVFVKSCTYSSSIWGGIIGIAFQRDDSVSQLRYATPRSFAMKHLEEVQSRLPFRYGVLRCGTFQSQAQMLRPSDTQKLIYFQNSNHNQNFNKNQNIISDRIVTREAMIVILDIEMNLLQRQMTGFAGSKSM